MEALRETKCLGVPEVLDARPPFSNFDFVEQKFGSCRPLQRILSLARMAEFSTIVLENISSVGYSKEEDEDLLAYGIQPSDKNLIRISFFKGQFSAVAAIKDQKDSDYLGYAILKVVPTKQHTFRWIVFESVIKASRHVNNYYHVGKEYEILCGDKNFKIKGTIYCQQNGLTSVCAHVALRTAIATTTGYDDVSYKAMNEILKKKGCPHRIENRGLTDIQIKSILDDLGIKYSVHVYEPQSNDPIPFQKYIYGSIESGYATLLGFYGRNEVGHVIPVLGHTFNEDTWVPNAETSYFRIGKNIRYVPSETWVSTYICHDDNFGPHFCLPRQYLTVKDKVIVISFEPAEAKFDAVSAEVVAIEYLNKIIQSFPEQLANAWSRRLKDAVLVQRGWIVLRPLFMSGAQYITHLNSLTGWEGEKISPDLVKKLAPILKNHYWIVEFSLPELFPANKRKLGEVVLDASIAITPQTFSAAYMFARLPGELNWLALDENKKVFLSKIDSGIKTHTQLYSH